MVLAANFQVAFERRGRVDGGRGWRSVPPQAQVQGLFGKQRLDQRQVQARHTPAVQHQDLIAWTQTWEHRQVCCRKEVVKATQVIHRMLLLAVLGLYLNRVGTFIECQSIRKHFADKNPAVSLAVYVSCYCKT